MFGAGRELGVGAPRAAVGGLHRAEQLLLQHVGGLLVELLVGLAEGGQRLGDLLDRDGEVAQDLSLCLRRSCRTSVDAG